MEYAILQFMAMFVHFPQWPEKKYPISPWNQAIQLGAKPVVWHGKNHQKSGPLDSGFSVFSPKYIQISWPILPTIDIICVYIYIIWGYLMATIIG